MRALYWRKFYSRQWTRTHFVRSEGRQALCGEPVNTEMSYDDPAITERNCCKRCWKQATEAERARALEKQECPVI